MHAIAKSNVLNTNIPHSTNNIEQLVGTYKFSVN